MSESRSEVLCARCDSVMKCVEVVTSPGNGPRIEMFQCPLDTCGLKAALMFEMMGGITDEQRSWVEKEVARRGSFFPVDFGGGGGPRSW